LAKPWLRSLGTASSSLKSEFENKPVAVGFTVDKVALRQGFFSFEYVGFTCQYHSTNPLNNTFTKTKYLLFLANYVQTVLPNGVLLYRSISLNYRSFAM
jgi:hypothetical protein